MSVEIKEPITLQRKPFSVGILLLGSTAKTLQRLLAVKAVKALYPECSLHLIVAPEMSGVADRVQGIDTVSVLPKISNEQDPKALVAKFLDRILDHPLDFLFNWTESSGPRGKVAAHFMRITPAIVKVGEILTEGNVIRAIDAWTIYRKAWIESGIIQDIHEVDLVTTQALTALQIHIGDPVASSGDQAISGSHFFGSLALVPQPIEWAKRRRMTHWILIDADSLQSSGGDDLTQELIEHILTQFTDVGVLLQGSNASDLISFESDRVIPLDASTALLGLASMLTECSLVMGKDASAAMNLASVLGIRMMGIQSKRESSPYGNGHLIIEAETQDDLFEGIRRVLWATLKGGLKSISQENLGTLRLWQTRIRIPQEGGGVHWESLIQKPTEFTEWMAALRGQMARKWFCGWNPPESVYHANLVPTGDFLRLVRIFAQGLEVMKPLLEKGRKEAAELSDFAAKVPSSRIMRLEDREMIEGIGKKLMEIEALMSRVIQVEPELKGILKIYQEFLGHLKGQTITSMADETEGVFALMIEGVELCEHAVQSVLGRSKLRPVSADLEVR